MQQWNAALETVFAKVDSKALLDRKNPAFVKYDGKTDENGVTEFFACFGKSLPTCDLHATGRRDGFRKVQFFTDPGLTWDESGAEYEGPAGKPFLSAYVSLRDCRPPHLILKPVYRGVKWLFVEQISVMSNGTIILERALKAGDVNRETSQAGVIETAHLILDEREVEGLRKAIGGQQVLIRMTGQKGYVGIEKKATTQFAQGFLRTLKMHDAILGATSKLGPVSDPMCPA